MSDRLKSVGKVLLWVLLGASLSVLLPDLWWLHNVRQAAMIQDAANAAIRQAQAQQQAAQPATPPSSGK